MLPSRLLSSAPREEIGSPTLVVGRVRPPIKEESSPLGSVIDKPVGRLSPDVRPLSRELAPFGSPVVNPPRTDDTPLGISVVIGKFDGNNVDSGTLPPAM